MASALDAYAQSRGRGVCQAFGDDQDAMLTDLEKNVATGHANAAAFFTSCARARSRHVPSLLQRNANFVGWDLIGYPGITWR